MSLYSYFYQNHGTDGSIDTTAVTVYRVLLTILGNTTFRGNTGGGATLLSSRLDVRGTAIFDSNTAVFGAGIAMAGRSLVSGSLSFILLFGFIRIALFEIAILVYFFGKYVHDVHMCIK